MTDVNRDQWTGPKNLGKISDELQRVRESRASGDVAMRRFAQEHPIALIKFVRALTGLGLVDSKSLVDSFRFAELPPFGTIVQDRLFREYVLADSREIVGGVTLAPMGDGRPHHLHKRTFLYLLSSGDYRISG